MEVFGKMISLIALSPCCSVFLLAVHRTPIKLPVLTLAIIDLAIAAMYLVGSMTLLPNPDIKYLSSNPDSGFIAAALIILMFGAVTFGFSGVGRLYKIQWRKWTRNNHKKSLEDDLICPITHNLMVNPGTAKDGRFYEEFAWKEYCRSTSVNADGKVKSPWTGEWISQRLLILPQQRSIIETSIENGYITGDLADDWKKRMKEKKGMEYLLKKAEGGDVKAMEWVAYKYYNGKDGFKKNLEMAYKWYDKARIEGSVLGMALVGSFLAGGVGGAEKDKLKSMMYLSAAAERGSDFGSYIFGMYLAAGLHDFPVDKSEACILLKKSLSGNCPHKNMSDSAKHYAQELLDRIWAIQLEERSI